MGKGGKVLERGINRENFEAHKSFFDQEGLYYPGRYQREDSQEQEAEPALVLEDVSMEGLLQGASATVPKGRITAILGPSGCGKTTLFRTLLGKKRYGGSIKADFGQGLTEMSSVPKKERFLHMGIVFQIQVISLSLRMCTRGGGELPPVAAEAGRRNLKGEGGGAAGGLRPWSVPEIFPLHAEPGAAEASGGAGGLGWGAGSSASGRAHPMGRITGPPWRL